MAQDVTIHVSTRSILKIIGIGILMYLLYMIWNILLLLFVSLILAALIDPFATWFAKKRIPRSLAVLIVYVLLLGVIGISVAVLLPVIANDVPQLVENLGNVWSEIEQQPAVTKLLESVQGAQQAMQGISIDRVVSGAGNSVNPISGIFTTVSGVFGGLFSLVLVLVITYYMVVQDDPLKKITRSLVPDEYVPYITQLFKKMHDKLGLWMRGQLLLSAIVGILVFVGLAMLGVKYAAILALLAALLEFIPYLGPILAAVPALIFGFSQGGIIKLAFVAILYIIIQQLENHILVPKIMQRAVGLNPVVSIVAILIGARIAGILGALLAIPVATALSVFFRDLLAKGES